MLQAPQRATVRGPTFVRLLARLTAADVPQPRQSLSDRLSQWIDWTHAVALSTALDGRPAAASDEQAPDGVDAGECVRVRAALASAIVGDRAFMDADAAPEYPFFRQRYLAMQQAMEANVGQLRDRLRDRLARGTTDMARLAAVDAVMERALGRRERMLLATVPTLLGEHFERLRQAAQQTAADADELPSAVADAWLDVFRRDMRSVLLAELDVRLQPAEGLLAALHTRPS